VGLARCGTVFPVSAVVGAAVPAAVCRWGLCPCCPGVGRCLSGVYISSSARNTGGGHMATRRERRRPPTSESAGERVRG